MDSDVGVGLALQEARERAPARRCRRSLLQQADVQAVAAAERRRRRVPPVAGCGRQVDDVGAAGAEVGAGDADVACRRCCPMMPCHWKPNSAALSPVDLDDQALDVDLRAARVELVDHRAQLAVQRLGRGDDQRVGRRVGLDEAAGRRPGRRLRPARWPAAMRRRCRRAGCAAAGCCCCVAAAERCAGRRRCRHRRRLPANAARSTVRELGRVGVLQVDHLDVAGRRRRAAAAGRAWRSASAPAASRAGLAARTISELLRGSASTVARTPPRRPAPRRPAPPAAPPPSTRRCTSGAMSAATACCSGITSTSVGGRHVQRRDDLAEPLQVVGVVGDDQRVVARVGVDRVVRADQRPQHRHQVVRRSRG